MVHGLKSELQVKMRRKSGPDLRVKRADVDDLMQGKLLVPRTDNLSRHSGNNRANMCMRLPVPISNHLKSN